ncbi:Leucine-rich receptor-like protein kinase family protein [Rhynchospora pubera]|uniref:Receptor kinase-like protein Xa21 n=1 Tax=Rhynchospora pubera TaxID=906938 RepID=A0AAV8ER17_9POAL|nr:Leucine-rich receptor-like protein kinase family protein [Rhynchospora pubera]
MEHVYHLLAIHLLLYFSSFPLLAAKLTFTSKTDLAALLSFKSQISSDPFGVLSSWNESIHHCEWPGVLCGRHHPDRVTALVLNSKQLTGCISPSLSNLTFLQRIDLSDNQFDGSMPAELGKLARLRSINVSMNSLEGVIPSTLGNCSNLEIIQVHNNKLRGNIPSNLAQCRKLKKIYLGNNFLTGGIPPTLGNLTNLIELRVWQNRLSGFIPATIGKLQMLQWFDIFSNFILGEIPHSLYNISTMVAFDLGSNQLEGTLPFDMCSAFSNLERLHLYNNQFKGQIPPSISNCSALKQIELDTNNFSGIIPFTIGFLENLQFLAIGSGNKLEAKSPSDWMFLDALGNCTYLQGLYLNHNQLQGVLPKSIANLSESLKGLRLSGNPISGRIPPNLGKLTNLETLRLDNMLLDGTIPEEIGNLFQLKLLTLSGNMISGRVPVTFSNLTLVEQLSLSNNALEGSIPQELSNMQALQMLFLSNNKFTGKIPKEIMNLPLLIYLDLSNNYLTDILPPEIGILNNVQSIWLSNNKLSGEIPNKIDGCQILQTLYLDGNMFQGVIPSTMGNMRGLQDLDLSKNFFSGQVPEFMGKLNLLHLNISFNNFEGELPKEGVFINISGIDIRGNSKLCGGVAEFHLTQCMSISKVPKRRHHSLVKLIVIVCFVIFPIGLTIGLYFLVTFYSRKRHIRVLNPKLMHTDRPSKIEFMQVSYHDLVRATNNFSLENLVGRGTFGSVYKADMSFEHVTTVAVKVLNLEKNGASRSFLSECEALRNVRHRNLIKVLSSCSSIDQHGNDFKALVFEFMSNGNLAAWLHPNAESFIDLSIRTLNLVQRLSIAIDVATALEYLHYNGPNPIVHCDIKPSNVLLDDTMTAHLGDFGLARFLVPNDTVPSQSLTSTCGIRGSIGYIPPEYGMGGRPSMEGDVYSYGILLLEMFTGVSPTDEKLRDGVSLLEHIKMAFPESVLNIVDTRMFSGPYVEANTYASENVFNCLFSVIQCGLLCSNQLPKERITIRDAAKQLNTARKKLLSAEFAQEQRTNSVPRTTSNS